MRRGNGTTMAWRVDRRRISGALDRPARRSHAGSRRYRGRCRLDVVSVMPLPRRRGNGRRRSSIGRLAQVVWHHLAATMVTALHNALTDVLYGDSLLVVMNGGALCDIVDLGMIDTRDLLQLPAHAFRAQNGEHPSHFNHGRLHRIFSGWWRPRISAIGTGRPRAHRASAQAAVVVKAAGPAITIGREDQPRTRTPITMAESRRIQPMQAR